MSFSKQFWPVNPEHISDLARHGHEKKRCRPLQVYRSIENENMFNHNKNKNNNRNTKCELTVFILFMS